MKKHFSLIIIVLVLATVGAQAQVVNYGDSNYMAVIYTPNPPLNAAGEYHTSITTSHNIALRFHWADPYQHQVIQYGKIFAVDSTEHIYGIAFTADTVVWGDSGPRRDKSIPIGLYLYNVPRGTDEPILLDSIIVDCTLPYKKFVYHAFDTYAFPHEYLHDTVPVYERLFSREHVFGPDDSVFISYGHLPTPKIQGLECGRWDVWIDFSQAIWPGDIANDRLIWEEVYTYDHSPSGHPGPIFPIRHRACPEVEGLRVDSVDGTRVWISWPPVDSATFYHLEYGPSGFKYGCGVYSEGRVVEVDSITGTSYCISGTNPDEVYTYFVSAYCSTMKQFGMPDSVRIAANDRMTCPMAEGLRIDSLLPHGVRLAWDTVPEQLEFQLYVRRDDTSAIYLRPDRNPYDLTGLRDSILYTVILRAQCRHLCPLHDTIVWGRWGHPLQFSLESPDSSEVGVQELHGEPLRVAIVPNPAHGSVTIVSEGLAAANGTIVITDAAGRRVLSEPLKSDGQQVDIAALPAGVYFVTLTTPQGSASAKLAVE